MIVAKITPPCYQQEQEKAIVELGPSPFAPIAGNYECKAQIIDDALNQNLKDL